MLQEHKEQIIEATKKYMAEKSRSQNDMASLSRVNISYISHMLRGEWVLKPGGKEVPIADKYFNMLAEVIGLKIGKTYWEVIPTRQFLETVSRLEEAKRDGLTGMIIGETGSGKTYGVDKFCSKQPIHTYRITVSQLHHLSDVLDELLGVMHLTTVGTPAAKVRRIEDYLRKLKMSGEEVLVIIDEAENLKVEVFGLCKALYDQISDYAGFQLIGTPELPAKLERLKRQSALGIPQFIRRFKSGTRYLPSVDRSFKDFFEKFEIKEKSFMTFIRQQCDNYGELHDFMEPVFREADNRGETISEDLCRLYHNIPKPVKA